MSLQRGINLRSLAEKMGQCSGAEVRGICTEAGMYALRERRQHVTQEDFEFAIAKVRHLTFPSELRANISVPSIGVEETSGRKYVRQQVVLVVKLAVYPVLYHFATRSCCRQIQNPDAEDKVHVTTDPPLDNLRHTFRIQRHRKMVQACPSLLATGACQTGNCTKNHLVKFCESCRLVCQDVHSYTSHLRGRGHAAKLKYSSINVLCTICDKDFIASSWDSHLRGQKHLKAARQAGQAPQILPQEGRPPPGSLHCRLCNNNVKANGWGAHESGSTHRKKEQYFVLKAVFDIATNDKGSAIILPPEELDFETVEPAHAQQGVTKQLVIQVTDPSKDYKIVQVTIAGSPSKRNTA